jgi:hypothetical protein
MSDFLPVNGKRCERAMKQQYCMDLPVYAKSTCVNRPIAIAAGCSACCGWRSEHSPRCHGIQSSQPDFGSDVFGVGVTTGRSRNQLSSSARSDEDARSRWISVVVMRGHSGVPGKLRRNHRCLISGATIQHEPEHDLPHIQPSHPARFATVYTPVGGLHTDQHV